MRAQRRHCQKIFNFFRVQRVIIMTVSPLLHGKETGTPLDLTIQKLYFLFPLSKKQVEFLNTIIYKDEYFWINYWSLTHTGFGMFWGLMNKLVHPKIFSLHNFVWFHTIFEIWELWAGGYLTGKQPLTIQELLDVLMDSLFGIFGYYITNFLV